jgi:signal transduction histidine kinase
MTNQLQILLTIYSIILVINLAASIVLYRLYSHKLFKLLIGMWGGCLLNFLLQGIYNNPGLEMYVSFSTYLLVSFSLHHFSNYVLKKNESFYKLAAVCVGLFFTGIIILLMSHNYFWASWFAASSIVIPMFMSSYQLWRSKIGSGEKVLALLLFFNAAHFLDYPILISHELGALWGFSIALMLLFAFSTFLPGYILIQISRNYSSSLETEVKNRTKELEDAVDQNKILVNILCHDLSSPLTTLNFYFDEIKNEQFSPVHIEYGSKAMRSMEKILNIVAKVKDLQAFSYDKKMVEIKKINLLEVITESIEDFETTLTEKRLVINVINLTTQEVSIMADWDLLKNQVLSNLLSNAIKFSQNDNHINITVLKNENFILVTIEDKGIGIPSSLLPGLFKWSEQTSRIGTNGEQGTGFGLPIVKACIEMMKGNIRVESVTKDQLDSDSGSKFILQFDRV